MSLNIKHILFFFIILQYQYILSQFESNIYGVHNDSILSVLNNGKKLKQEKKYEEASVQFELTAELAKTTNNDSICFIALDELGQSRTAQGLTEKALSVFFEQLRIAEDNHNIGWTIKSNNNLGVVYYNLSEKEKSLYYIKKAYTLAEQSPLHSSSSYLRNLGAIYAELNKIDSAILYMDEAVIALQKDKSYGHLSVVYALLGQIWLNQKKEPEKAYEYYQLAITVAEENQLTESTIFAYSRMGMYFLVIENFEQALIWNRKASSLNNSSLNSMEMKKMLMRERGRMFSKIGIADSAFILMENTHILSDSLYREQTAASVAEMEVKYQTEKKDKELQISKSKIDLTTVKLSKKNTQLVLLGVSLIALVGLGGFIFYRRKQTEKLKLIQLKIREQKKGVAAIFQAQESERQRIAKDLHDGVGQTLSALKMGLLNLSSSKTIDNKSKNIILSSANITNEAYNELRTISHQMMPATLKEFGLAAALELLLEKNFNNLPIIYNFDETIKDKRYSDIIEISLYRICQELINNIIKHSKCQKVNIHLYEIKNNLIIMIEDDGIGIKKDNKPSGIGLQNIRSRIDAIDSVISFQSEPNKGTLVTIKTNVSS